MLFRVSWGVATTRPRAFAKGREEGVGQGIEEEEEEERERSEGKKGERGE